MRQRYFIPLITAIIIICMVITLFIVGLFLKKPPQKTVKVSKMNSKVIQNNNPRYPLALLPMRQRDYLINMFGQDNSKTAVAQVAPEPSIDEEEWNFVRILNAHRQSMGRQILKPSVKLTTAAEWMSNDMASHNQLNHVDSLGRNINTRFPAFGYQASRIGENVAAVGPTGQNAFNAWLASTQGHKEEMENGLSSAIGISRVKGNGSTWFWTADFGTYLDAQIPESVITPTTQPTSAPTVTPTSSPTITPTASITITPSPTGSTNTGVTDCGTEVMPLSNSTYQHIQCMIDNANTCTPAKAAVDTTLDLAPLVDLAIKSVINFDFAKNNSNKCAVHLKVVSYDIARFPQNSTDEQKENARNEVKKWENKEGTCVYNQYSDAANFFRLVKLGGNSDDTDSDIFKNAQCSGTYFDALNPSPTTTPPVSPTAGAPTATPTTYPGTSVLFSIKLSGIGKGAGENPNPKRIQRVVTVKTYDAQGNTNSISGNADYNSNTGLYDALLHYSSDFSAGTYYHLVKVDNSLYKRLPGFIDYQPNETHMYRLLKLDLVTGDIDQDNSLSVKDYNLIVACYKSSAICNTSTKTLSDLNDNGITIGDTDDFAILQRGFAIQEGD